MAMLEAYFQVGEPHKEEYLNVDPDRLKPADRRNYLETIAALNSLEMEDILARTRLLERVSEETDESNP